MKRNILAVLIPVLLVAGAANAAEIYNKDGNKLNIYGKAEGARKISGNKSEDGDDSVARIGLSGETQVSRTHDLTGYGRIELDFKTNKNESDSKLVTRLGYAGLSYGVYGSLDYGRNWGIMYDVAAFTDVLPSFGNDTYTNPDNFLTGRANGVLTYRNTDFFGLVEGLNIAMQYQGRNEGSGVFGKEQKNTLNRGAANLLEDNGDGYGLSSTYDIGWGISAGAAYFNSDRTYQQRAGTSGSTLSGSYLLETGKGRRAEGWTAGLKYDANNIYLAATFAQTRNATPFASSYVANKANNIEIVAQYNFDFGLTPGIAYLQSRGSDLNFWDAKSNNGAGSYRNNQDLVKYVSVNANYSFNKNLSTYVDYKINLLKKDNEFNRLTGLNTKNVVALGIVYQF